MCIDAPESTTNFRSSGLRVDGAGIGTNFPKSEENAVFCFSFFFRIHLAIFHAASRHIALTIPSLPETHPQILEHRGYADDDHLVKSFHAMDSSLECQHDVRRLL